ncbi:MAG TPA: hypothetical protein VGK67_01085 [Myxococcales bacterium]
MDILSIVKQAWKLLWTNKYLWVFGFFMAGVGGGAGGPPSKHGTGTGGGHEALPIWLWPVLAVAALLAIAALVMHVVSEAALIEGIRERKDEQAFSLREGFRFGLRHFWRVLGVKALAALVVVLVGAAIVAPILVAVTGHAPLWIGIPVGVLFALVGVPALLTGYFLYEYALRIAVLDGAPATDAYRAAIAFLHGRIVNSIVLAVTSSLSSLVAGLAGLVAAVPAAVVGLAVYAAAGLVPGIVAGAVVLVPLMIPIFGAQGTFRSAVWTLGFLSTRKAA